MHTWPNQAGTALHESIVTGEPAPPPTRLGKGSPLLWPNQVERGMPACVFQTIGYQPSTGSSLASVHVSLARYKGGGSSGTGSIDIK